MAGSDSGRSDNGDEQQPRDHDHDDAHLKADEDVRSQQAEDDVQEPSVEEVSRPADCRDETGDSNDDDDDEVGNTHANLEQYAHEKRHDEDAHDADSDPERDSTTGTAAHESVSPPGRVSISSEHDDRTPTMAHREQFNALQDQDEDDEGASDHSPRAYAASASATASPDRRRPRRPFSLVSQPDSPSASSLSTLDSATSPARRPSLLASSMSASSATSSLAAAAADPTNVGRESSASLTQAVWRQSMGLHTNPEQLSKGLVDVQLNDEDGEAGLDEEAKEAKRKKRRSAAMSWNSAAFSSANGTANGVKSKRMSAQYRTGPDSATALAAPFEEDESSSLKHSPSSPPSPTHPQSSSPSASADATPSSQHDRSGSISTANAIASPHAADGFISHRASANLSSLMQPVSPANPPQSNTGIRALQANFESLRSMKERQGGGGDEADEIDWEFWGRVMSDYEEVARSQPRELSRAIQRGIPPALRGMTWQLMSAAKDENLEFVYSELLKQTSPHEKSIARDLNRTFPKHEYFKDAEGVGQENLFNVVKAYSIYDDEVGYTQGLQFIVGPLLLNMPDEEAFCVLVRLMESYDLRSHYTPNMPGLQLRLFQFDRLVEELVPSVFLHLLRQGVKSSMYASQWFLTLFGYRLPLELVSSVFDLVFAEGVEALFRFAVALLKRNEAYLLTLEFEELIDFLKNGLFEAYAPDERELMRDPDAEYRVHEFVREALQVRITPMMLDQFAQEWASLCAAQTAHAAELDALRQANHQLSRQVRQLESSLAQINLEHCELVKQVVASRLEREELEDELVKYKLAYADLSHVAAASQASASPIESRRQSEMSIASVSDDSRSSSGTGPVSAGLTAGLGSFGGRWFGGSARGSISSTMSRGGSQGA
ncbi:hypothetical protein JCM8115_005588 [Rhodotorula mucilaginosa]